jgi:hypothetical protein
MTDELITAEEFRRIADVAQPHITALCTAIGLDAVSDNYICKALIRDVLAAVLVATITKRREKR